MTAPEAGQVVPVRLGVSKTYDRLPEPGAAAHDEAMLLDDINRASTGNLTSINVRWRLTIDACDYPSPPR